MEKSLGIIISVAIAILIGVILVQIIAGEIVNKAQLYTVTDTFTLVRDPPGGLYNTSNGINTTYSFSPAFSNVDDAWRQDITECAKKATIDPSGSTAAGSLWVYNSSGSIMANGVDYVVVTGINSIRFLNTADMNGTANTATVVHKTCPTEYVSGWGQTVFLLVPGFFVLAILLGAAFVIFYILRQEGIQIDF